MDHSNRIKIIQEGEAYPIRYWSNCCGDLFNATRNLQPGDPGFDDIIDVADLPDALQRAYLRVWREDADGARCYLVETEKGYGIALIGEYDDGYAKDIGLSMGQLWEAMLQDAKLIAVREEFWCADIYCIEKAGVEGCHELAVVFPASIPERNFDAAVTVVGDAMYSTPRRLSLTNKVAAALKAAHEDVGDYNVEIHKINIVNEDMVEAEVSFNWKLNGWEKAVTKTEFVVKDSFGFWNIVGSISSYSRFK